MVNITVFSRLECAAACIGPEVSKDQAHLLDGKLQILRVLLKVSVIFAVTAALAADFHPPAAQQPARITASGTILPGGRILKPWGTQLETGPEPMGLAVSRDGIVATADTGRDRNGVTILEHPPKTPWRIHHIWARTPHSRFPEAADPDWKGVSRGIAFSSPKSIWISEGESGKIRLLDVTSGEHRKIISLNTAEWRNSETGDLAFDSGRRLLYVIDETNSRVVVVEEKSGRVLSSIRAGPNPREIALSPEGTIACVASESGTVWLINTADPSKPEVKKQLEVAGRIGGVLAIQDRFLISDASSDSIVVVSAATQEVVGRIPLRIPSLEQLRGIEPRGMAWDPLMKWVLVAESGINAVGIVDLEKGEEFGHIPSGWKPVRVAVSDDRVYVANARGRGAGPKLRHPLVELGEEPATARGSVTTFIMPGADEVLRLTGAVFSANGFVPEMTAPPKLPGAIKHVVLIMSGSHSFDELLGDMKEASNGPILSFPQFARFGMHGRADGRSVQFSVQDAPITPNHHALAGTWALNDNFYADNDENSASLVEHARQHGVTVANFDGDADGSSQQLADRFTGEIEQRYRNGGEPFPQLVRVSLVEDQAKEPRPADGYPYEASFVEENDLSLGRIVESLSHSPWWKEMLVLVAQRGARDSLDHVDAHRSVLIAAGPWVKRNYASHTNSTLFGVSRLILELLHAPPMGLMDATAASLQDLFTSDPDSKPFAALQPDPRIFNPSKVRRQQQ
jgi:DNA-binding beta-propeller fold protein YncE